MDVEGKTFEKLLDSNMGSDVLSADIKKAEMAISDLVALVKVSKLRNKELVVDNLQRFLKDAKSTGRGLQRLTARIGGAVDGVVVANNYALRTIEIHLSEPRSLLTRLLWTGIDQIRTKLLVTKTFASTMVKVLHYIEDVIEEAQGPLQNLDNLEVHLALLHDILMEENALISDSRSQLLAELWTMLGGNKRKLQGLEGHLELLRNVGDYRTRARGHVVVALKTLSGMREELETLRNRVSAPQIEGDMISVEIQMRSIEEGMKRLSAKRLEASRIEGAAIARRLRLEGDA